MRIFDELFHGDLLASVVMVAPVRHNSKVDETLVFFIEGMSVTSTVFVNFLEVNLDQVLAHVELGGQ